MSCFFTGTITADEREKLYDEIWSEPVTEVAKRYGISDVGLRKHCIRYGIPLPYRGYWARIRTGQKLPKTPLPPVKGVLKKEIRNYLIKYKKSIEHMTDQELKGEEELSLLTDETKSFIGQQCAEVCAKDKLRNPHTLILKHKEEITYRKKRDRELRRADFSPLYYAKVKSQYRDNEVILPIFVSDNNINRAYRIIDALIKAIEEMEGHVSLGPQYERKDSASIVLLHTSFGFEMKEKSKLIKKDGQEKLQSNLILSLSAHSWFSHSTIRQLEYKDANNSLEDQIGKIIYDIFVAANQLVALAELSSREQNRKWEEEKRLRQLEEFRKKELEKVDFLSSVVSDWNKAKKIRRFADAMEQKIAEVDDIDRKKTLLKWIKWARDKADWLDPLTAKEDKLLGKGRHIFKIIDEQTFWP